jgi:hypothetical protein
MASAVAIVGKSGSGKTTSLFPNEKINHIGLDPNRTMIVNVSGKDLPVKGGRSLYPIEGKGIRQFMNYNVKQLCELIEKCDTIWKEHIDNIVVDDAQYLQAFEFMARATERGLN